MRALFTSVQHGETPSLAAIEAALDAVGRGSRSLVLALAGAPEASREDFDRLLRRQSLNLFGGIFPRLLIGTRVLDRGFLVAGLSCELQPARIAEFDAQRARITRRIEDCGLDLDAAQSLLALVRYGTANIDGFLSGLYDLLGSDRTIFGGGAGLLEHPQAACLITNHGLGEDAGLILALPEAVSLGVRHGWESIDGPFLVTHADDNIIHTLNYQPALQVYRSALRAHRADVKLDSDFAGVAAAYPFGLEQLDQEFLVRDPVAVQGDSLVCVGDVPENALVYILHGEAECLMNASAEAARSLDPLSRMQTRPGQTRPGQTQPEPTQTGQTLLFDCISRALFLGDAYPEELRRIGAALGPGQALYGVATLGEIASSTGGPPRFLNKSTVLAGLP